MRKPLCLLCLLFSLSFGGEHPKDEDGDEMIALYECKGEQLRLVWHHPALGKEEIDKLKKQEGVKCKGDL